MLKYLVHNFRDINIKSKQVKFLYNIWVLILKFVAINNAEYIVMNMTISGQQIGKHVPDATGKRSNRRTVGRTDLSSVHPEL
jgi:hypothetical protein